MLGLFCNADIAAYWHWLRSRWWPLWLVLQHATTEEVFGKRGLTQLQRGGSRLFISAI